MQLLTSKSIFFFDDIFRKKLPFKEYNSLDEPTLFFGVYSNGDVRKIIEHSGIKIVLLNGSDSLRTEAIKSINDGKTIFIAGSKWVADDLDKIGIKYEKISFFIDDIYNWKVEPLGTSLYWYNANNSRYGKRYLPEIKRAFPDLDIIIHDNNTVPRNEMPDIYKKCFAGIRPVEHDGQSHTVSEMGLMGRMSIWNGDGPFSVHYEGINGLIEAIRRLRRGYSPKLVSKRTRGYFVDQERKWSDLILRVCGTDEMGIAGIFDDSKGRCGSIFRIQRKSDIERIGGFGESQFERPWFYEQMNKLGKKTLITSKNSGFIASEFKNTDKMKGYPNHNFQTHDKTTD